MQQERSETPDRHPSHIKEIASIVGAAIVIIGLIVLLCYLTYVLDLEPLKQSGLGTRFFFDPDGLSLYERVCVIFGWV